MIKVQPQMKSGFWWILYRKHDSNVNNDITQIATFPPVSILQLKIRE